MCEILLQLADIRLDFRLSQFLVAYKARMNSVLGATDASAAVTGMDGGGGASGAALMKGLQNMGAGMMDITKHVGGTMMSGGTALLKGSLNIVGSTLKGVTSLMVGGDDKEALMKRARREAETLSAEDVLLFQDMFKEDDSLSSLELKSMTDVDVTAVLMDLILYKHPRLVNAAFELFTRTFSQVNCCVRSEDVMLLRVVMIGVINVTPLRSNTRR